MHLYLRLLKDKLKYNDDEVVELKDVVLDGPGVERVKLIEQHIKGGYTVTLDISKDSLEGFFEYLSRHQLTPVL